ncbi:MAG: acetyl-CoA C-acyltransferase [Caulobacterales bacterium]|nr:acetyl-CoA C-acyltransferase [Caulobacterales bacterium]MCA0371561.1 acetyl-CoA C-acyltransferase [Pseudomonadota bacterium]
MTKIVITGAKRTPIGALLGQFSSLQASDLGAIAIKGALEQSQTDSSKVDWVLMGNVLGAGQGQAPARQAALKAGLSKHAQATTLNKMCGSGMQAVIMGKNAIIAGEADIVVAGGMESMTNAPFLLKDHRGGSKYGHGKIYDHMALDGLEDAYEGHAMGVYADEIAQTYNFTREMQDDYALETLTHAQNADFKDEIIPVTIKGRGGDSIIDFDELPKNARPEKIRTLKPAFNKDGTVTAANASGISDGASALVLMCEENAKAQNAPILATLVATSAFAHEPSLFTTAPVYAMKKALSNAGWYTQDVDLWEINEAFAVVPMIAIKDLGIERAKVNVNGGACALGHPIGASGARIITTLIYALKARGLKKGVASLCIGGGEATAICIEV